MRQSLSFSLIEASAFQRSNFARQNLKGLRVDLRGYRQQPTPRQRMNLDHEDTQFAVCHVLLRLEPAVGGDQNLNSLGFGSAHERTVG